MDEREAKLYRNRLRDLEDDGLGGTTAVMPPLPRRKTSNPRRLLVQTFLAMIFIGGALLCTPWSQLSGRWAWDIAGKPFSWSVFWQAIIDNLFMATSASCVTGLTVVTPTHYYSDFGMVVLFLLIQLGGIGIMTLSTLLIYLLMGRLSARDEAGIMLTSGAQSTPSASELLKKTVRYAFFFESLGAVVLFSRYYFTHGMAFGKSWWYATYHAVSAFCNAGISLHPENLVAMQDDKVYMLVIAFLVTVGGLGFLVLANLSRYRFWKRDIRQRGHVSLQSRIVLWSTLGCVGIGTLLFLIFEWNGLLGENRGPSVAEYLVAGDWDGALSGVMEWGHKAIDAVCQTTMFRTAGFNFFDLGQATQQSTFVAILVMLIGGSPASTAGGIKTTTVVILYLTIRAMLRGEQDVCVHHRTIPPSIVREAMVIVFFYFLVLVGIYMILLTTEPAILAEHGSLALFYEVTSALGTVGTSINSTGLLTPFGRVVISVAMFLGRVGPITLAMAVSMRNSTPRIRYPEENVIVG